MEQGGPDQVLAVSALNLVPQPERAYLPAVEPTLTRGFLLHEDAADPPAVFRLPICLPTLSQ
jgi:hypothetical protein